MIISSQKKTEELLCTLEGKKALFLIGCGACATACKSGGEEEVFRMEDWLIRQGKEVTGSMVIEEACHILRAGRDLRQHKAAVERADALMVLACGAGVQSISVHSPKQVVPALDSLFLGNIRRIGEFEEKCSLCGNCILDETAGVCPVTNCAKGLLNGPCGGMEEGRCEADRELDCAWARIFERLEAQGRAGVFERTVAPKNWSAKGSPGRRSLKP